MASTPSDRDGSENYPTPSASSATTAEHESTVAFLERLSAAGVHALNVKDHHFTESAASREVRAHIAPEWRGQIDTYTHAKEVTFAEQSAMWAQRAGEYPDVHFEIMQMSTDMDEKKGEAIVWMEMDVTGLAEITLQAMNELTWRRVKGQWMLYHTLGLRGSKGNTGGVGFG